MAKKPPSRASSKPAAKRGTKAPAKRPSKLGGKPPKRGSKPPSWPTKDDRKRHADKRPEQRSEQSARYHNPPQGRDRGGRPAHDKGELILRNLKAVEEYLIHKPEALLSLEAKPEIADKLHKLCLKHNSAFNVAKIRSHNAFEADEDGLVAKVRLEVGSERDLDDHLAKPEVRTILVLDHIKDPRNFGAIARSCGFFGVTGIVIPNKRQVGVTQIVVDTAMGAFAKLDVFQVANLSRVIKTLKDEEFWVVGTSLSGQSLTPKSLSFAKTALVIGSEDSGISPLIEKNCDLCLRIEGAADGIDSLNVSVATGIFLQAVTAGQSDAAEG